MEEVVQVLQPPCEPSATELYESKVFDSPRFGKRFVNSAPLTLVRAIEEIANKITDFEIILLLSDTREQDQSAFKALLPNKLEMQI